MPPEVKKPWRPHGPPASCSAEHATTSDRYRSMRFVPFDTLVYTFNRPGVVLSIHARRRGPIMSVAQKKMRIFAPLCSVSTESWTPAES